MAVLSVAPATRRLSGGSLGSQSDTYGWKGINAIRLSSSVASTLDMWIVEAKADKGGQ